MFKEKRSFFEKLTGTIHVDDELEEDEASPSEGKKEKDGNWMEEDNGEGQLMVDVFQTPENIIVQAMVAGVKNDNLNVSITREMVTISGKREQQMELAEENYFYKELYWGAFSRTILLPQEVEPDLAEAVEKNGLITIKLPKIDKEKT